MTQVEIFNLALVRIKEPTVQSASESSHQAEVLTVLWPSLIEKMLRGIHWHFARKFQQLAVHADDPPENWSFRYALPTDMVRPRRTYVVETSGTGYPFLRPSPDLSLAYSMLPNDAATEMTLVSMWEDLFIEYTFRTIDPVLWPVDFCDALAWHLATESLVPLTGRSDLADYCLKGYVSAMSAAITHNANSVKNGPPAAAAAIKARY